MKKFTVTLQHSHTLRCALRAVVAKTLDEAQAIIRQRVAGTGWLITGGYEA